MEVRIERSNSQTSALEKNISISGAVFSKELFESLCNSLRFVSALLDMPLTGFRFVIRILPFEGGSKSPKLRFELQGKSVSFPFAMLLLSILLDFKLPQGAFFSGCLWDTEGWLARTNFRIVESKARCLSDMKAYLNTDDVAFYVPKWILNDFEKPLLTRVATVKIWGVQNILQCLKLLNPKIYKNLHSVYAKKFLNAHSLSFSREAIRAVEAPAVKKGVVMLLFNAGRRPLEKTLMPKDIKQVYETDGLKISEVVDLRSEKDTLPVLVYLITGGQIRWKEMFMGSGGFLPRNRFS